ncbi:MAG: methyltransferase domain-containing protein [Candidatus Thermoplasmatota archaeon]|nr:methyltransferase domain-containing protein [Candidatus Thermoplasmatota archaeon]
MKLNLGCGKVYKLGYVNIDSSHSSVADEDWDIMDLPLRDSSVDLIEMDQVIEHFDWVNVKYLLAECWRVLKPDGRMVIETPDLMGAMKKLKKLHGQEFLIGSQWLFGIDTKGQRHGIVFTERELGSLLTSSGFIDVVSKAQRTYKREPGLRIECTKGSDEGRRKIGSLFRKKVRKIYKGDSYFLIPAEDLVKDLTSSLTVDGEPREPDFTEMIYRSALGDPQVPVQLLLSMQAYGKGRKIPDDLMGSLRSMHENDIRSRAFTMWMKRRKGADIGRSFQNFMEHLASRLSVSMQGSGDPFSDLDYLLSLEPTPIAILDLRLVADRSLEWLSQGLKEYSGAEMDLAKAHFERSHSAIPNPTALWNIARIDYIRGARSEAIKKMDRVIGMISDGSMKKEAKRERELMTQGTIDPEELGPRNHVMV